MNSRKKTVLSLISYFTLMLMGVIALFAAYMINIAMVTAIENEVFHPLLYQAPNVFFILSAAGLWSIILGALNLGVSFMSSGLQPVEKEEMQ